MSHLKSDSTIVRHFGVQDTFAGLGLSRRAINCLIKAGVMSPKLLADAPWTDADAGARYTSLQWRLSVDPDANPTVMREIGHARVTLTGQPEPEPEPVPAKPSRGAKTAPAVDTSTLPRRGLKPGERIYAIGDVHGRLDLLEVLMASIREDNARRGPARTRIVLLGDLIDRGPQVADLVARAMKYARATDHFVVLKGNHEAMMVSAMNGDFTAAATWLKTGGDATLRSWGVPDALLGERNLPRIMKAAREQVPPEVVAWMGALPLYHREGDVLFVHAGIRPGVEIAEQTERDLLWITDEFLTSKAEHPVFVVHGHSASAGEPDLQTNRIGVDTGAYATSRLTAVGLEGEDKWLMGTA